MIGDVAARHQKVDVLAPIALLHFEQKIGDAFMGGAAQQQAVALRAFQFGVRDGQHVFGHREVGSDT